MASISSSRSAYFPSQPEIQKTTGDYQEIKVEKSSRNSSLALFYQFKTNKDSVRLISLIPDGCFDILFCCSSRHPSAILWTSPLLRRKQPNFLADCVYFGVRFYPEQSLFKLKCPMKELLDRQIPLFDVLSLERSLVEQIGDAQSFQERIDILEHVLNLARDDLEFDQKIVTYSIERIYLSGGNLSLPELSGEVGYTPQYIRKKFEKYIGFSPKQFCQVVKFQNSLDTILGASAGNFHLIDITLENGFYDQSHFIRGFKKFASFTPKQYMEYLH